MNMHKKLILFLIFVGQAGVQLQGMGKKEICPDRKREAPSSSEDESETKVSRYEEDPDFERVLSAHADRIDDLILEESMSQRNEHCEIPDDWHGLCDSDIDDYEMEHGDREEILGEECSERDHEIIPDQTYEHENLVHEYEMILLNGQQQGFLEQNYSKKKLEEITVAYMHDHSGEDDRLEHFSVIIRPYMEPVFGACVSKDVIALRDVLDSRNAVVSDNCIHCAILLERQDIFELLLEYVSLDSNDHDHYALSWAQRIIQEISPEFYLNCFKVLVRRDYRFTYNDVFALLSIQSEFDAGVFEYMVQHLDDLVMVRSRQIEVHNFLDIFIDKKLIQSFGRYVRALCSADICVIPDAETVIRKICKNYGNHSSGCIDDARIIVQILVNNHCIEQELANSSLAKIARECALFGSVVRGDVEAVEKALICGVNPNAKDMHLGNYVTCLEVAAMYDHIDCMNVLVAYGARFEDVSLYLHQYSASVRAWAGRIDMVCKPVFSSEECMGILQLLENDYSKKQTGYALVLLGHNPSLAQNLLMHAPYQFINPKKTKFVFSEKTQKIELVTDEVWFDSVLCNNSKKITQDIVRKKEALVLYADFVRGKNASKRLYDTKFSDVEFK